MIKYIPSNPDRIFFRVQPLNSVARELVIREGDLPPGSLLFVKHGEILETKKLIAQSSHVKLTKQRLPESSYPVYSPLEGQIFFESMNLLIEKEISIDIDGSKKKLEFANKFLTSKNSGLPDLRRMAKIGSFWIFSAYNQHEIHTLNHFVEPGDLVSSNTILFNYKFHTRSRFQLQKINSKLTFGTHSIQIPIKKINYFKTNYKIYSDNLTKDKFIFQKIDNNNARIFWYPLNDKAMKESSIPMQALLDSAKAPTRGNRDSTFAPMLSNLDAAPLKSLICSNFSFKHFSPLYTEVLFKTNLDLITYRLVRPKGLIFSVCFLNKKYRYPEFNLVKNKKVRKNFHLLFLKNLGLQANSTEFLVKALENRFVKKDFNEYKTTSLLSQDLRKIGWVFILKNKNFSQFTPVSQRQFFPAGVSFHQICFPKRNVSIKNLTNIGVFKNKLDFENSKNRNWYTSTNFITQDRNFLTNLDSKLSFNLVEGNLTSPLKLGLIWYFSKTTTKQKNNSNYNLNLYNRPRKYFSYANLFLIQPVIEYSFPTKKSLKTSLATFFGKVNIENPKSFIFCKQKSTILQLIPKTKNQFQIYTNCQSGWFSLQNLFRIQFLIKNTSIYPDRYFGYQMLSNNLSRGLNIYQYHDTVFSELKKFSFKAYWNRWVLPFQSFSSGAVKIKTTGEFRYKVKKTTGTFISILRHNDLLTIKNSSPEFIKMGKIVRWGEQLEPGTGSDHNGQILKKNKTSITLRLGTPVLASAHGIIHVFQDDLVEKNQLLITLKSRRLQTEDIVQGIPKIEQLFEARERQGGEVLFDTVHIRLRNAFLRELGSLEEDHWSIAVEKSFLEAQQFLVENIVEAYANQGVKISEKHVEVIVRQMTSRVRILESGETGLLPGELVQHTWIQKFNKNIREIGLREATYEPIALGISKSVLQSESFLLAASFQEVSRVLVRSALSKKRDFLRGLHENVIVGQLIPAGTGLLSQW
jgi:hypothetical protein